MARVLVIDDDQAIVKLLERYLGGDHEVVGTTRGRDALARIEAGERFDVIFSDVNMPGMSGLEVRTAIAHRDAEQARRIVFITARGVSGLKCIQKPFKMSELRSVIEGYLPIAMASGAARAPVSLRPRRSSLPKKL